MSALERGNIVAGRYRLERALAQGGMGCVWVARHLQLDTEVAIKFMTPQFAASADARARFEREARTSAALRLANAVQIHDYGVEDGAPFLVMELLTGEDLQARLKREPRLSLAVTVGILAQVCRALRRAHEVGVVHRDLKPGNVFLAREGGEEVVKLLDFGIAKDTQAAFGGGVTGTGALLGSPHYMSPEQVRSSNRVDHRTDLWALSVIAFRCLTGRLPFPSEEIGEVLIDVCTAPIPLASEIAPDLGPGVDGFFARALTRDPAGRFQSADELIEALAALVRAADGAATAPVVAPPAAAPIAFSPAPAPPPLATVIAAAPGHAGGRCPPPRRRATSPWSGPRAGARPSSGWQAAPARPWPARSWPSSCCRVATARPRPDRRALRPAWRPPRTPLLPAPRHRPSPWPRPRPPLLHRPSRSRLPPA